MPSHDSLIYASSEIMTWVEGPRISLEEVKRRRFLDEDGMRQLQQERRRLLGLLQQRQVVNSLTAWERLLRD